MLMTFSIVIFGVVISRGLVGGVSNISEESKVKQSRYTPWRRLEGEEV
jgi:hypothetical protein